MKKKMILIVMIVLFLLLLLIPIPFYLNDGGTIEWKSLLYTVTRYHKLADVEGSYMKGMKIKVLGKEVYNNVEEPIVQTENNNEQKPNNQNQTAPQTQDEHSFVGTVLEETTTYMIVEPNEDEEIRKSADKIKINYGTDHIDYLYGIGRKVIVCYTGYVKETYPAQIDTNNILINGYEEFELSVKVGKIKKPTKILNNKDLEKDGSDYYLYYYGIDEVNIKIQGKTMSLEEALKSGKMTIDGLVIKANKDFPNATVYKDGGSIEYHYNNYTIIKMHKEDGNRDVYIGTKDMTLNDIQ